MPTAPVRFDQDSVGAPDMFGGAGSLNAWLRFGLVTNNTWTEPFVESGDIAAFNNGSITLQVDDSDANYAILTIWEGTMTAPNTGGTQVTYASGSRYFFRSYSTTPGTPVTEIYCNNEFFNLVHLRSSLATDYYSGLSFGKVATYDATDSYAFFLAAQTNSINGILTSDRYAARVTIKDLVRDHTGAAGGIAMEANPFHYAGNNEGYLGAGYDIYPDDAVEGQAKVHLTRLRLVQNSDRRGRGFWPGVLVPLANRPYSIGQIDGQNHWARDFYLGAQLIFTTDQVYWDGPTL